MPTKYPHPLDSYTHEDIDNMYYTQRDDDILPWLAAQALYGKPKKERGTDEDYYAGERMAHGLAPVYCCQKKLVRYSNVGGAPEITIETSIAVANDSFGTPATLHEWAQATGNVVSMTAVPTSTSMPLFSVFSVVPGVHAATAHDHTTAILRFIAKNPVPQTTKKKGRKT